MVIVDDDDANNVRPAVETLSNNVFLAQEAARSMQSFAMLVEGSSNFSIQILEDPVFQCLANFGKNRNFAQHLVSLTLHRIPVNSLEFLESNSMSNIECLRIEECPSLDDACMRHLGHAGMRNNSLGQSLKVLSLSGCENINTPIAGYLWPFTKLYKLVVNDTNFSNIDALVAASMSATMCLRVLHMQNTPELKTDAFYAFGKRQRLIELAFTATQFFAEDGQVPANDELLKYGNDIFLNVDGTPDDVRKLQERVNLNKRSQSWQVGNITIRRKGDAPPVLPPVSNLKHPNAMVVKTSLDEFGLNRQPQLLQFQQDNQQPQPQQQQPQQQQPGPSAYGGYPQQQYYYQQPQPGPLGYGGYPPQPPQPGPSGYGGYPPQQNYYQQPQLGPSGYGGYPLQQPQQPGPSGYGGYPLQPDYYQGRQRAEQGGYAFGSGR